MVLHRDTRFDGLKAVWFHPVYEAPGHGPTYGAAD